MQRLLLGHASECQMDGAGRLLIAPVLRQHAGLTKEVMLVGQFNKFELWDETTWHQQVKEDIDAEQLATRFYSFCLLVSKIKGRDCGTINGHDESLSIRALMKDAREVLVR